MTHSTIQLTDLPDELLLIIFTKLNVIDLFNSLAGINQRLDIILHDPAITNHLTLFKHSSDDLIHPLDDKILDRFCLQILPEIHDKIKWLNLELSSMERIFQVANYPNLSKLGLYNIDESTAGYLFHSMFSNLCDLNFKTSLIYPKQITFNHLPQQNFFSHNLLQLKINMENFEDCLFVLDGRFNQLHTLDISLLSIRSNQMIQNKEKIVNLKRFTLACDAPTQMYDELIIPLLHRMSNLEKLGLYLGTIHKTKLIDGNDVKKDIIDHLLNLQKFQFNIYSFMFIDNLINLPCYEDIQSSLKHLGNNKIISCINYYPKSKMGYCNICSYPCSYAMKNYHYITNSFPGGSFNYVRKISLFDEYPFEHDFFIQISQSFEFIEALSLTNLSPQEKKMEKKNLLIVKFHHLNPLPPNGSPVTHLENLSIWTDKASNQDGFFNIVYST
ncbi:unnamed protein product [Rotaria sordida]|uniref:F-box domain-containing protein n=1 Tax=Rotaria sordida TaxID=392033 RepID=A0A815KYF9_9BILA|nr:unnamed protein product [Rotaria sordida]CAF4052766.1 unnamed protein product [Rotaria sordida]